MMNDQPFTHVDDAVLADAIRSLPKRLPPALRLALAAGRLLIISFFP